ncbi:flagellar biosynthesis protein FlhF [Thalassotalea euphylliae]|uniref:flagellar biosynthesis protein FlhF n=1 Tax=Thalassotalea euphylliae TaxID=1655234 RepID=UPI0036448151
MKIKRYVAKDMRTALAQIKEELGADAVIMSNKKIPEGVELMAAVDGSQPSISKTVDEPVSTGSISTNNDGSLKEDVVSLSAAKPERIEPQINLDEQGVEPAPADSLAALLARNVQQNSETAQTQQPSEESLEQQLKAFTTKLEQQADTQSQMQAEQDEWSAPPSQSKTDIASNPNNVVSMDDFNQMKAEMASIRQLLEHQVSGLMWQDMAQKDPSRAMLIDRLVSIGITEEMADQIAGFVPGHFSPEESWHSAMQLLKEQLNTTNNDIIHRGGVVSLVGPTGVGKTTTLAKLAARFAQMHGADQLALISTDTFRIGGFEQLETYGKIIGCQVKLAKDAEALEVLLQQFSNKKLVLIDTAGMGQRDLRLAEHLSTLVSNNRVRIRNYLVLSANSQQAVMQENVERFKKIPLCGCIFTKLDESLSMGEIITTSIQNGLPIGYLTDGQRVPEDIKVANAEKLVSLAEKIASKSALKFNFSSKRQSVANVAAG